MFTFFKKVLFHAGVEIKKIDESELHQLQSLATETFRQTYKDYISQIGEEVAKSEMSSLYSTSILKDWLTNADYVCLGLYVQGELKGFSLMKICDRSAILSKLYILDTTQNKGLGNLLMEANFDQLRKRPKITKLELNVWDKNNKAISFYEKRGFRDTGIKEAYPNTQQSHEFFDVIYSKSKNTEAQVCPDAVLLNQNLV